MLLVWDLAIKHREPIGLKTKRMIWSMVVNTQREKIKLQLNGRRKTDEAN